MMISWLKCFFGLHMLIAEPASDAVDALFYVAHQQIELHNPFRWPAIRERFRCSRCGKRKWM